VKSGDWVNKERDHYVTREETRAVLDACLDVEWRAIVALARYAALRCPTEVLGLRWADVLWGTGRLRVQSQKTKHHSGAGIRFVPICPELEAILAECFEAAEPGAEFVIMRYRGARSNLRTQLGRIIADAGLKPWPKLFQNMRATRETEWIKEENFSESTVSEWVGHTVAVGRKHYHQSMEADFERARKGGAKCGAVAAQNAVQQTAAGKRGEAQQGQGQGRNVSQEYELCASGVSGAPGCAKPGEESTPRLGLEPRT